MRMQEFYNRHAGLLDYYICLVFFGNQMEGIRIHGLDSLVKRGRAATFVFFFYQLTLL